MFACEPLQALMAGLFTIAATAGAYAAPAGAPVPAATAAPAGAPVPAATAASAATPAPAAAGSRSAAAARSPAALGVTMTSVDLLSCSGLPCVDTTLGSKHVRLLIDTGDVEMLLSDASAAKLGLELKPLLGRDRKPAPNVQSTELKDLKIGTSTLGAPRVLVASWKTMTNGQVPLTADGFITYPAFKNRVLQLDFAHKTLSLSEPLTAPLKCQGHCGSLRYPTFGKQGPPIVMTSKFAVDGKPVTTQIDTMFTGSILIYPHAVSRLKFENESHSSDKAFFPYTDGGVDMIRGKAGSVAFDGALLAKHPALYFATPAVHAPDGKFDGTVGLAILGDTIVTFDFHDNWISVVRPG